MPSSHVVFYQEKDGDAPVVDWLKELRQTNAKAFYQMPGCHRATGPHGP